MCPSGSRQPAKPSDGGPGGSPANACVDGSPTPCPTCQPISAITVFSLEFLSDHQLLKNDRTDWKDSGARYPKPDWSVNNAQQSPVSHNMDQQVQLKVTLKVDPPDACAEVGTLEGSGPGEMIFPPISTTFQPGLNPPLVVTSTSKLPVAVARLAFTTQWTMRGKSGQFTSSSSTECFVTVSTPLNEGWQEDGVTYKRMAAAVDLVSPISVTDRNKFPFDIVGSLMAKIPYYTLKRDPAVPLSYHHPQYFNTEGGAWPICDYINKYAECQAIVRWGRGIIKQIGCPGEAKAVVIWADPDRNHGGEVLEAPLGTPTLHNHATKKIRGHDCHVALAAADSVSVGTEFDTDASVMNMYEACLKFTYAGKTKYYGGGAGVYNNKEEVIKGFKALVWYRAIVRPSGVVKLRVEEVVHVYR